MMVLCCGGLQWCAVDVGCSALVARLLSLYESLVLVQLIIVRRSDSGVRGGGRTWVVALTKVIARRSLERG